MHLGLWQCIWSPQVDALICLSNVLDFLAVTSFCGKENVHLFLLNLLIHRAGLVDSVMLAN